MTIPAERDPVDVNMNSAGHDTDLDRASDRTPVEMILSREQFAVATAWQESGRVRITRTVVTERRTIEVDVRREELTITAMDADDTENSDDVVRASTRVLVPAADLPVQPPLVIVLHEEILEPPVLRVQPYEQVTILIDRISTEVEVTDTVRREELDPDLTIGS